MIYKDFLGLHLSALGVGAMRLPTLAGDDSAIDRALTAEMIAYAMEKGINYFDTAWGYHGGQSEVVLGELLKGYPRDSFFLADKFPGYDLTNMDKAPDIFEQQLKRCQVEYFDFYMFHNVCEMNIDAYLDPRFGLHAYLAAQKDAGRIRHLGFSAHGSYAVMKRFLEAYGDTMEFCQIQLNYLDWTFQDAKAKVALLDTYGIPVWVMEPLRGGQLATLPKEDVDALQALRPDETIPAWAFRFAQSIPSVKVVLSGMSNMQQLVDNIHTFETARPLEPDELKALTQIAGRMIERTAVPCTACRYCTGYCPQQLDIPHLLSLYNEHSLTGGGFIAPMALSALPEDQRPSACMGCKRCEAVCPQQIRIASALSDFQERLAT